MSGTSEAAVLDASAAVEALLGEEVWTHGYVALAEALDVPLLTADRRLAKTAARYCDVVVL